MNRLLPGVFWAWGLKSSECAMKTLFLSSLGSGLMTLGLVASLTAPSFAAPILQPDLSVPSSVAAPGVTPVRDEWAGGNSERQWTNEEWRWRNRDGRWRSGNFRERNFSRNWDGDNNWNGDDWRWRRHHHRRHFRDSDARFLVLAWVSASAACTTTMATTTATMLIRPAASIGHSGFPGRTSSGATTATVRIGLGTIRSSPITARASSAGRHIAERQRIEECSNGVASRGAVFALGAP